MNKYVKIAIVLIVLYFVGCVYLINKGIRDISINSFKIGCMNVQASAESIEICKTLAEEKVGNL